MYNIICLTILPYFYPGLKVFNFSLLVVYLGIPGVLSDNGLRCLNNHHNNDIDDISIIAKVILVPLIPFLLPVELSHRTFSYFHFGVFLIVVPILSC